MQRRRLRLSLISLAVALSVALPLNLFPPRVVVTGEGNLSLQTSIVLAAGEEPAPTPAPAYQVCIPNGEGSETGLSVFPPKLQIGGKDNWLAVQSPDGLDVPVGTYTYDVEKDPIAVDKYSGAIRVDSLTNNLIITAGALSEKCKYDIEVADYTLYGGEKVYNEEKQKDIVSDLRAKFRSYVYGSGSDLYQLENTSQNQEKIQREITAVRIYAVVVAQEGVTKATASTKILVNGKKYDGVAVPLTSTEQRIGTTYITNPKTGIAWTWQDIDDLEAGVTLKSGEYSYVYVEVELVVHSQTFYPITPVEVTPGTTGSWQEVNVSAHVPSGATGVILHIINTHASQTRYVNVRKKGSTDNRYSSIIRYYAHVWAATGVDANRVFEAYVSADVKIYLIAYTVSGVTFFTNAYNKSLSSSYAWEDIDCSDVVPVGAIGLIFETYETDIYDYIGFRKKGSTDNRTNYAYTPVWVMIGCNDAQVCQGYTSSYTDMSFFLIGYITDGAVFNTNATDISLGTTGSWQDLPALPEGEEIPTTMGFIEVKSSLARSYGLRENDSSEDFYYDTFYHNWAFVKCDANQIIEGKIENTSVDFFVVGYAGEAAACSPNISNAPDNWSINGGTPVVANSNYATGLTNFSVTNSSGGAVSIGIKGTDMTGGGYTWTLSDTATPGDMVYGLKAGLSGGDYTIVVNKAGSNNLTASLGDGLSQDWGLKLWTPTVFDDGNPKEGTVTLTGTCL